MKYSHFAVIISLIALLVGCDGGGGGRTESTPSSSSSSLNTSSSSRSSSTSSTTSSSSSSDSAASSSSLPIIASSSSQYSLSSSSSTAAIGSSQSSSSSSTANNTPTIEAVAPVDLLEDAAVFTGQIMASDVDNGAILTYSASVTAGFEIDPLTGAYSFDPSDDAYQSLAEGETLTVPIPITVTDEHDASVSTNLVFNLTGTNDNPTILFPVEQKINTNTDGSQGSPAGLSDGGYVIAWTSFGQDGSEYGIYAQRFDSEGNPIGGENQVNTYTTNSQYSPSVTGLSGGGYVIAWESDGQDGSAYGIYVQRFDSMGNPLGGETQVNSYTDGSQGRPVVTGLEDGGYVIAWESYEQDGTEYGIYAQRYDSGGNPLGGETQVNTYTAGNQSSPKITGLANSSYVIAWVVGESTGATSLFIQRYNSSGSQVGGETLVKTYTTYGESDHAVTGLENGNYIIAWIEEIQDGSWVINLNTQRYDSEGNPVGSEALVQSLLDRAGIDLDGTGLTDGGYVITWTHYFYTQGVYAKRYDSGGNPVGDTTLVNTYTYGRIGPQSSPAVTGLPDGGYVMTWKISNGNSIGDIYAQRYDRWGYPTLGEDTVPATDLYEDDPIVSGKISATDIDHNAVLAYTATKTSGFVIDAASGAYSFDPSDDAYQYLSAGEALTVSIPVTVTDEQGAGVTIDIIYNLTGTYDIQDGYDDLLYPYQWHLDNTGQEAGAINGGTAGEDINVDSVWNTYMGLGVVVSIVDSGIEKEHPDLQNNLDLDLSFRYSDSSNDPSPDPDQLANDPVGPAHGTACAGIVAAEGWNGIGGRGVAPKATLIGLNVFSNPVESSFTDALSRTTVDISSNSWGPQYAILLNSNFNEVDAMRIGATYGRSGEGIIYLRSAGNEKGAVYVDGGLNYCSGNANFSDLANNRYQMSVAAVAATGKASSYSNYGYNILIAAPGGEYGIDDPAIVTTDLLGLEYGFDSQTTENVYGKRFDVPGNENGDYTSFMNGTSAACPTVSGVVALMLEANPNLTYRDVKYILAHSARKNDPEDGEWVDNAAGLHFNHQYGYGVVDAQQAVDMAQSFTTLGEEQTTQKYTKAVDQPVPDNGYIDSNGIVSMIPVTEDFTVEHVNVWFTSTDHTFPADLVVILESPSGTRSILAYGALSPYAPAGTYSLHPTQSYDNWRFSAVNLMDEPSKGEWKLYVYDSDALATGTFENWSLQIYGH